jgi:hypothetical protein
VHLAHLTARSSLGAADFSPATAAKKADATVSQIDAPVAALRVIDAQTALGT